MAEAEVLESLLSAVVEAVAVVEVALLPEAAVVVAAEVAA